MICHSYHKSLSNQMLVVISIAEYEIIKNVAVLISTNSVRGILCISILANVRYTSVRVVPVSPIPLSPIQPSQIPVSPIGSTRMWEHRERPPPPKWEKIVEK